MISVTYFGVLVLWAPKLQDKLHAFGPNFKEIDENILFDEPEDVYDLDLVMKYIFKLLFSNSFHRLPICQNLLNIWLLIYPKSQKPNYLKKILTPLPLQRP